jgi:hypothetical protein
MGNRQQGNPPLKRWDWKLGRCFFSCYATSKNIFFLDWSSKLWNFSFREQRTGHILFPVKSSLFPFFVIIRLKSQPITFKTSSKQDLRKIPLKLLLLRVAPVATTGGTPATHWLLCASVVWFFRPLCVNPAKLSSGCFTYCEWLLVSLPMPTGIAI